ncbi:MAG: hypothetical protein S4CHLAM81_12810 [Chlamydiales bacterium]|nr:hypothetical protein [Chlamydiales bacterium]MCH9636056.1 hypothetical protein [Chlamydiales bacterium]MCH9703995.1 TauD/TfdA family dioxygenase [Chlamydiota bacterium]
MKESFLNKQQLPLVIQPTKKMTFDELLTYIEDNRESLSSKITKFGGILLRGFPIEGATGFNKVIETLNLGKQLNYIGGDSPRDKVKGKVYTSTEAPPKLKIPLHNEMSFIKNYPRHIYFYCDTAAASGGATIIGDAREIAQKMDPSIRKQFEEKGLRYISNYYKHDILLDLINKFARAHKRWTEVFETEDKSAVEKMCQEQDFEYQWRKQWVQIVQKRPALMKHESTGELIWFNQAHLYDYNPKLVGFWNYIGTKVIYARPHTVMHEITYGDKSAIKRTDLYKVMRTLDDCTISYPWQKNDMVILDNVIAMHGRAPFSGKRKILTALTR